MVHSKITAEALFDSALRRLRRGSMEPYRDAMAKLETVDSSLAAKAYRASQLFGSNRAETGVNNQYFHDVLDEVENTVSPKAEYHVMPWDKWSRRVSELGTYSHAMALDKSMEILLEGLVRGMEAGPRGAPYINAAVPMIVRYAPHSPSPIATLSTALFVIDNFLALNDDQEKLGEGIAHKVVRALQKERDIRARPEVLLQHTDKSPSHQIYLDALECQRQREKKKIYHEPRQVTEALLKLAHTDAQLAERLDTAIELYGTPIMRSGINDLEAIDFDSHNPMENWQIAADALGRYSRGMAVDKGLQMLAEGFVSRASSNGLSSIASNIMDAAAAVVLKHAPFSSEPATSLGTAHTLISAYLGVSRHSVDSMDQDLVDGIKSAYRHAVNPDSRAAPILNEARSFLVQGLRMSSIA